VNIEKKLEFFANAVTREAESKKRQARQQITDDFNAGVLGAIAEAEAGAIKRIAAEKQTIEKASNKCITESATQARSLLATLRESLTNRLFDDITADVIAFCRSPEYESYLINSIQAAYAKSKHPYEHIQLAPEDMRLSDSIQKATGLSPEQGDASIIGGFRLLTANRGMAAEYTFRSGIDEVKQEFSIQLSKLLVN